MTELFTLNALCFFAIGLASMLTHAVKKWAYGEIRGRLIDWYWTHPRATVSALLACVGGIAAAILTGVLTDYSSGAQILAAWGVGYGADSLNSQSNAK